MEEAKRLRMKCSNCGHWNRVSVNKIFIEQNSLEPKDLIEFGRNIILKISSQTH